METKQAHQPAYHTNQRPRRYIVEVYNDENGNTARASFFGYQEAMRYVEKMRTAYGLTATIL